MLKYERQTLINLSARMNDHDRDEMAIPSYLHKNPLIRWIVTRRMHTIIDMVDFQPGQHLLDFGCGTGMLFLQLPHRNGRLFGVDLITWPAANFLNEHKITNIELLKAADWTRHVPNHSLDTIVALEVLEHVDDVPGLMSLFKEKLKPGGTLVVCGPTENKLYALGRRIAGFSGDYHHRNIFDIMQDVHRSGFNTVREKSLPVPGPACLFRASLCILEP